MDNKPFVSICTPVYNGEEHLEGCIKGVLNQTYENFEYIIVDNASTDNTPLIIEKYRMKDPRIKVYRNEKTVCMEDNCNLCAGYCSNNSQWIKYALADDYLFPDCVEKMVKVGEMDEQIGIVSAYRIAGPVKGMGLPTEQNVFNGAEILKQQILRKLHVADGSPNSVLYKKCVFFEFNGLNNKYNHSDVELVFKLLDKYKLGFVHYVLTKVGEARKGGIYYSIKHGFHILEYLDFGYKNLSNYKSISFDKDELDYLRMYYAREIMSFLITKCACFEWEDIMRMIRNIPEDVKKELKKIFIRDFPKHIIRYFVSLIRNIRHKA